MYQECSMRVTKVADSPIFCDKTENTRLFISQYINSIYTQVNLLPIGIVLGPSNIIFIIFWSFLTFYQIFLSPQVKRCTIITYKHDIYKLPHELPNDLK